MKKYVAILACIVAAVVSVDVRAGVIFSVDTAWQEQFANAVRWSMLGISDDSGTTDNTAALNALPANQPIIADCPHGGYVSFSGNWHWQSGLTIWQQPGCWLKSTITTPADYPIMMPVGTTDTAPIANVQYYGMNFGFVTPTSTVRVMQLWVDHFKFKYFMIDGSGGFAFLRGSDQEIAYGVLRNTVSSPGNPGIRHFGNVPLVTTSPGMRANDWFHNLNFQTGDASFQACQPGNNSATWFYNTSTDGLLYEDSYGESDGSAVILVNAPMPVGQDQYYCKNITYRNIRGYGLWFASVGNSTARTENVMIDGGSFDGSMYSSNLPSLGVGTVPFGGSAATSANTTNVTISNVTMTNVYQDAIEAIGSVTGLTIIGNTLGAPRVGIASPGATIALDGTSSTVIRNNTIVAGNSPAGIALGAGSNVTANAFVANNTITGINNSKAGISIENSSGVSVTGNTIAPASGATSAIGVSLTADPNGTNNALVSGNDASAMPTPIVCASGQGNSVTGNAGVANCAP
ncbi:right-handed parallel beta-helix repeat-containing protein [Rhodoblastus acidophilus]|uniref:Right-handed parallel beta-helix repeat-containing protein n=1 Tax=Candidatus Rhodoblastus alkanivorans TaxID=2954117 RepID=A0ABS9Z8V9_9HYPH|nr:right-handed parallel beta-helix repeat-containing protein [Candidatus Rhodoblastus alkanivorans]MCI4680162.1 right-handed parallel beta-helix repeat-containing protein [Candidatus Rhodoblastus alkanivorans]MCI4684119.1 right-handed parallel beta-helix repeat-containing protein [Candidatus Rhodoblastus alkanivorans]MDI4641439.1 right-handed parallel beta-helix repeat-containing protein [Rhodoblastus acidophilus]